MVYAFKDVQGANLFFFTYPPSAPFERSRFILFLTEAIPMVPWLREMAVVGTIEELDRNNCHIIS